MQKKFLLGGALFAVILMGASCAKPAVNPIVNAPATNEPATPAVSANVNSEVKPEVPAVKTEPVNSEKNENQSKVETKTFNLALSRFKFEPNIIEVSVGDTVVINANATDTTHGLSLPEYNVNLIIPKGTTQTTSFVADKPGTYTFRCSVYCGAGHTEMTGTLIVK